MSPARKSDAARARSLVGGCTRSRRRALSRLRVGMLVFAACLEPQLALADTNAGRAELPPSRLVRTEPAPSLRAPSEAEEAPLELRVSYRAPRDCPSSGDFLAALQQHVAAGGSGAIDADVRITRASATEFELVLRLRVEGKSSESVTRAESCLPLVQLAALDASMARTAGPEARGALGALPPPFELAPSPRLEAAAPFEPAAAGDAGSETARTGSRRAGEHDGRTRPFVLGEVRSARGMLPQTAWGRGLSAGVARDLGSLRVSATLWQGQSASFAPDGTSPMQLAFEQRSLALAPCAGHALTPLLRLDGCALLGAHRISTNAESARTYASVGAAALASLSPWSGLRIELEGSLSAAIRAPSFGADRVRYLYEPESIQPSARVALGWEFGGGT